MPLESSQRMCDRPGCRMKLMFSLCVSTAALTYLLAATDILQRLMHVYPPIKTHLSVRRNTSGHGDGCVLPKMELWPPLYRELFAKPKPLDCSLTEENWVYVDRGMFQISASAIRRHGVIKCIYTPLFRGNDDFTTIWGDPVADMKSGMRLQTDFFKVNCTAGDNSTYFNIHAGIRPVHQPRSEPSDGTQNPLGLNILMIGFDSTSRLAWMRNLPKTYAYLVKVLGATVMEGYNIVGDGTVRALLPILTGHAVGDLPETRRGVTGAAKMDRHPWIWRDLKRLGYVTQFAEDKHRMGAFTLRMRGFQKQPVDHDTRTYYRESEKLGGLSRRLCTGSLPRHVVFLNYARELYRTYPARMRKFSFLFYVALSHDSTHLLQVADDDLVEFLKDMNGAGHLDNTMLIMMADHGQRFTGVRLTAQGKMEERNPFMSFRFPPSFARTHPEAMKNLRTNAKRLTTPFDIHATFEDIVDYKAIMRGDVAKRGISLLTEIPANRTCQDADVGPHFCACLAWSKADFRDAIIVRATAALLAKINAITEKQRAQCKRLFLYKLFFALRLASNEKDPDTKGSNVTYQLGMITKPNNGYFEATLVYSGKEDRFHIMEKDISRVNLYGKHPDCVARKRPHLRKYCYCKRQIS